MYDMQVRREARDKQAARLPAASAQADGTALLIFSTVLYLALIVF